MSKISKDINLVKSVLFAEDNYRVTTAELSDPKSVEAAVKKMGWTKERAEDDDYIIYWCYKSKNDSTIVMYAQKAYYDENDKLVHDGDPEVIIQTLTSGGPGKPTSYKKSYRDNYLAITSYDIRSSKTPFDQPRFNKSR